MLAIIATGMLLGIGFMLVPVVLRLLVVPVILIAQPNSLTRGNFSLIRRNAI
jgi:hypothetical protein